MKVSSVNVLYALNIKINFEIFSPMYYNLFSVFFLKNSKFQCLDALYKIEIVGYFLYQIHHPSYFSSSF